MSRGVQPIPNLLPQLRGAQAPEVRQLLHRARGTVALDERWWPCSGLDPISTHRIEETLRELKSRYTFVLVTNNTKQAARVADRVAFFLMGQLIEDAPTDRLFTAPKDERTNDYLSGRFG